MDAIICDGAVRSGKTLCLGISFVCWALRRFDGMLFGICGRSVMSVRRNITEPLIPVLRDIGFTVHETVSKNCMDVSYMGRSNRFYLFGGGDEDSASHIQGITLAGVLMDEAALMPRSFVEQACARCSVEGSKLWFNCNPESPSHWFYREWILRAEQRGCLYLHFSLEDNPSLSRKILDRYRSMYTGDFYRRFILGEWVLPEGRVYDFFDESMMTDPPTDCCEYAVSCDYGTANPSSFGLWGRSGEVWYRLREYYYDSRKEGVQKTDAEYVAELKRLCRGIVPSRVIVDPSAASFISALRREGFNARKADNDVLKGLRITADALKSGRLRICRGCRDFLREISEYRWDVSDGREAPLKLGDHAMDDMRYFATGIFTEPCPLGAVWTDRRN
ncbi:MAG: PBSX family phage terminase large subunit [Oscillospiraceae bacterium]|nr:PBSX family phage terminase large subunit [Oscillospiraceae bacterium]